MKYMWLTSVGSMFWHYLKYIRMTSRYEVYLIFLEIYLIDIGLKYTWYYMKYMLLKSVWCIFGILRNIFEWHRYEVYLIFLEVCLIDIGMKYIWYSLKYIWLISVWSILDIIWSIYDWHRYEVYLIFSEVYLIDISKCLYAKGDGEQLTITANHHHADVPLPIALMSVKRHCLEIIVWKCRNMSVILLWWLSTKINLDCPTIFISK